MTEPWERLPDESPEAAEAFAVYRDMGSERTTRGVAQQLGKSSTLIGRWSSQHGWVQRVAAYDLHLDRQRRQAAEAEIRAMQERYARIAGAVSSKVVARLASLNPDELKAGDIGPLLRTLFEVESKARGVANRIEVAVVQDSAEWQETKSVVLEALLPYPDALGAVVAALARGGAR